MATRRKKTTIDPSAPVSRQDIATPKPFGKPKDDPGLYQLPCLQGIQAKCAFWTAMVPYRLFKDLFTLEKPADIDLMTWHQRSLNLTRAKAIRNYMLENPEKYVLSAITATIDADVNFREIMEDCWELGFLEFARGSKVSVVDGQHRVAAIRSALAQDPELENQSLPVLFFLDLGSKRMSQMFIDLNQGAKPNKAVMNRLDQRNDAATLTRTLLRRVPIFEKKTDLERTSLTATNSNLFTLSALTDAVAALLKSQAMQEATESDRENLAITFWKTVAESMTDWRRAMPMYPMEGVTAHTIREETLATHAITLVALGQMGAELIGTPNWEARLVGIDRIEWARTNPDWEGICTMNHRIIKNNQTTQALKGYLQKFLLTEEEI